MHMQWTNPHFKHWFHAREWETSRSDDLKRCLLPGESISLLLFWAQERKRNGNRVAAACRELLGPGGLHLQGTAPSNMETTQPLRKTFAGTPIMKQSSPIGHLQPSCYMIGWNCSLMCQEWARSVLPLALLCWRKQNPQNSQFRREERGNRCDILEKNQTMERIKRRNGHWRRNLTPEDGSNESVDQPAALNPQRRITALRMRIGTQGEIWLHSALSVHFAAWLSFRMWRILYPRFPNSTIHRRSFGLPTTTSAWPRTGRSLGSQQLCGMR